MDEHWKPIRFYCSMCYLNYDYVIKFAFKLLFSLEPKLLNVRYGRTYDRTYDRTDTVDYRNSFAI